jgi:hypothetical protein
MYFMIGLETIDGAVLEGMSEVLHRGHSRPCQFN